MNVGGGDPGVQKIVERLDSWLEAALVDVEKEKRRARDGRDRAAEAYLKLIEDVVGKIRADFEALRANATAPVADRLRWLSAIGGHVPVVLLLLQELEGALAPRFTPLVAAFERLLEKLVPGESVVVRPFRMLNYELGYYESWQFQEFQERHRFPILFLKIPTGFLDTPRNHILVGHELGHAVATVHREQVVRYERERARAVDAGTPAPPEPAPLLPSPAIENAKVLEIALLRWAEGGMEPVPLDGNGLPVTDDVQFLSTVLEVAKDVREVVQDWAEELFADAVGTCLFGPAFVFAFVEVVVPLAPLDRASTDHPANATRLVSMKALLEDAELQQSAALPVALQELVASIMVQADAALASVPGPRTSRSEAALLALANAVIRDLEPEIRAQAKERCRTLLYTGERLSRDLEAYRERFAVVGVPPIGDKTDALSLATIFNVGQVVALQDLDRLQPVDDSRAEKEQRVDDLLLKAIELAEFQLRWGEV